MDQTKITLVCKHAHFSLSLDDLGDLEIKNAIRMYYVWYLNCQALSVGSMPRSVWFKVFIFKIKGSRNHKKIMNIGLKKRNQHHRVHILVNNKGLLSFFQKKLLLFEFELPMSILYLKHGS